MKRKSQRELRLAVSRDVGQTDLYPAWRELAAINHPENRKQDRRHQDWGSVVLANGEVSLEFTLKLSREGITYFAISSTPPFVLRRDRAQQRPVSKHFSAAPGPSRQHFVPSLRDGPLHLLSTNGVWFSS